MPRVASKGWSAWVVDPDTSRVMRADVVGDPLVEPSLNSLPRITLPIPRSEYWETLTGDPALAVYLDGEEQPIDELRDVVKDLNAAPIGLEGEGGIGLKDRIQVEYNPERRHLAAQDIIDTHTTYDADVDTPVEEVLTDQTQHDADTTAELEDVITVGNTEPIDISGGEVTVHQTSFTIDSLNFTDNNGAGSQSNEVNEDGYNNGTFTEFFDLGDWQEWEFTTLYDMLEVDVETRIRIEGTGGDAPRCVVFIDDEQIGQIDPGNDTSPEWVSFGDISTVEGDDTVFEAGTHTLRVEIAGSGGADSFRVDVLNVHDDGGRFNRDFTYSFPNALSSSQGWLDGPGDHPENGFDLVFDFANTAFNYIKAVASITIDDTGGDQRLQITHDRGQNYNPSDGTEDNTNSVTVDPVPEPSASLRVRVRLDAYSPSGTRDETPRENYDAQAIDKYTLTADVRQEALLLDFVRDDSIANILTEIAGEDFIWAYRIVDGTPTVTFTQFGQRVSDDDPELIEAAITKELETVHKITVKGANKSTSAEDFNASLSFTALENDNIVAGSESVYDLGANVEFDRGIDYEMNWADGEIRAVDEGGLTVGDEYLIDYRHEVQGTFEDPNAPAGFREETVDIPAVTSDRNAEQLAYVLVNEVNEPRWVGDILIPPSATDFLAVEALPLDSLGLPSDAGPFEVEQPPEVTPRGTAFRLGSRPELEARVAELQERVRQVARRSG